MKVVAHKGPLRHEKELTSNAVLACRDGRGTAPHRAGRAGAERLLEFSNGRTRNEILHETLFLRLIAVKFAVVPAHFRYRRNLRRIGRPRVGL